MLTRLKPYRPDALWLLLLFILPLGLFWDVTLGGQTMVPVDNLFQWEPWRSHAPVVGIATPHNSLLSDLILENYPWKQFVRQSLAQGEIPLWNPYILAGAPFLANGQHSAYYPFSWLFLLLPLWAAYGWYTVSHLWLAGAGMYLLGRVWGQGRPAALMAGLVYQGCGFMLVSAAVFPMILGAAAWLPILLACVEMILRRTEATPPAEVGQTFPWAAAGATALGLQTLAGHIEITYYSLLIMGGYAVWRLVGQMRQARRAGRPVWRSQMRPAGWLLAVVAVGIMLGAIQLVPFYEIGRTNFRQSATSLEEVQGWAFPPRRVLTLVLPNFFGNPAHHNYTDLLNGKTVTFTTNAYGRPNPHGAGTSNWGIKNYVEGGIYFGILPLALAAWGVWTGVRAPAGRGWARRSSVLFCVILAFLALNFIFGSPLYALLYYGLPFISQLHSPFRWVFALSLCVAALAGFGTDALLAAPPRPRWAWRRLLLWLAPGALGMGFLLALPDLYPIWEARLEPIFRNLAQAPDAFPHVRAFVSYLYPQGVILAGVVLGSGLTLWLSRQSRRWVWLGLALTGVDMWAANRGFHAAVDPALLDFKPALVSWLEQQPGPWRLTTFEAHGDKPFNANAGWLFGFEDVRGYDSVIDRQYVAYMAAIEEQGELPFNRIQPLKSWDALHSPLLDLLGVRFIITAERLETPKLQLVWEGEGLRVYENLGAVSRAYTMPDTAAQMVEEALPLMRQQDPRQYLFVETEPPREPAGDLAPSWPTPAAITYYSSQEVIVEATVDQPAWLVLNDTYQAGWRAFVHWQGDGTAGEKETKVYRVNGNFRAVQLEEPGTYSVRFRYSPLSFKLGGLSSFMGGTVLLFAGGVWLWRRYYHPPDELSNAQSVAKNSMAPMALNLFNKGIDFAFAAFYLRVLGPAENGAYATAIAIVLWFEIVANWGLNTLLIRDVAQDRSQAAHYLVNSTVLRLATTFIGAAPVAVYIGIISLSGNPLSAGILLAIGLLAVGMIFSGMAQGVAGLFYAYEAAEYPAAITTVTTILKVALGVLVLVLETSYLGLAAVSILVNLITLFLLISIATRRFPLRAGRWQVDWALQRYMLRAGYPLMLNHLLATIFWQIDVPLLRQFNGESVVGWYNAAYKWVNAFNIIPSFLTFALFPILSRQVQQALGDARRTYQMAIRLLILGALPLAATVTLLATPMIGALGGAEFLPHGAIALRLVIWSIPVGWINSVTNYVIISLGLERRLTWAFLLGVTFNTVGNLLLLERYSYVAAAITTILSEVVLWLAFNHFLKQRLEPIDWGHVLGRPVAATLAMALGFWGGAQVHLALGFVLGWLMFGGALWGLRVFGAEEQRILASILPGAVVQRLKLAPPAG